MFSSLTMNLSPVQIAAAMIQARIDRYCNCSWDPPNHRTPWSWDQSQGSRSGSAMKLEELVRHSLALLDGEYYKLKELVRHKLAVLDDENYLPGRQSRKRAQDLQPRRSGRWAFLARQADSNIRCRSSSSSRISSTGYLFSRAVCRLLWLMGLSLTSPSLLSAWHLTISRVKGIYILGHGVLAENVEGVTQPRKKRFQVRQLEE